ncbi:MarR family winged helix-turn-helix transcriptional regulator [Nonomuraea sp. JJY05]|uniref:MarR family winged helix-turn-helix transcriptional regulator n=1 Tax=Nonomuraea sp. JJY05 TaxID=3350255 RepID=UPI00373F4685
MLTSGDGVGRTDLSKLLHLEKPSLTGLVDRAERRGLVRRVHDDADRRATAASARIRPRPVPPGAPARLGRRHHRPGAARPLQRPVCPGDRAACRFLHRQAVGPLQPLLTAPPPEPRSAWCTAGGTVRTTRSCRSRCRRSRRSGCCRRGR